MNGIFTYAKCLLNSPYKCGKDLRKRSIKILHRISNVYNFNEISLQERYLDYLNNNINNNKCLRKTIKHIIKKEKERSKSYLESIYSKTHDCVVSIQALFIADGNVINTNGSGFVINKQGDIITAGHIVRIAGEIDGIFTILSPYIIYVTFPNKSIKLFTVVGVDITSDIGVLKSVDKMSTDNYCKWGKSIKMKNGSEVGCIGNTNNIDINSVTTGIIRDRNFVDVDFSFLVESILITNPTYRFEDGSPILNKCGEVIGVKTNIIRNQFTEIVDGVSGGATQRIAEYVSNTILNTKSDFIRPFIGIAFEYINVQSIITLGLSRIIRGILVLGVLPSGPADGILQTGDIINFVNGFELGKLDYQTSLQTIFTFRKPGHKIVLDINRNGNDMEVKVVLGNVPFGFGFVNFGSPSPINLFTLPTYTKFNV